MVQTQVNTKLALGVEGDYADDSPRREAGFIVQGFISGGTQAQGSIQIATNPTANCFVTVGTVVFTLSIEAEQSNGTTVKVGEDANETASALQQAIQAQLAQQVTATVATNTVTVKANEVGYDGNYITLATSDSVNITITAMTGGEAGQEFPATVGRVFSYTDTENVVQVGGENFAGVLVGPKQFALYNGLTPTLEVPNGVTGGICSFGHVFVRSLTAFKPNYLASYDKNTGAIYAYAPETEAPNSSEPITNAKFILNSGEAGTIGILELGA